VIVNLFEHDFSKSLTFISPFYYLVAMSMDYKKVQDFLFVRSAKGMKLGLAHIRNLLAELDNPENAFPSIHIAGTNGKGSTAAILESILRAAGYQSGLYTSPHLVDMRERIRIRGKCISEKEVVDQITSLESLLESTGVSFFEILTALAFLHFKTFQVDIAVLETGLGGRLDATNLVTPLLSIITDIGLDHTRILGRRLLDVAREKAGIMKPDVICLSGARNKRVQTFLSQYAEENKTPFQLIHNKVQISNIQCSDQGSWFNFKTEKSEYKKLYLRLLGEHQIENSALVIQAVEILREKGWDISEKSVRLGLETVQWPARLELVQGSPRILLDSAHNVMSIQKLVNTLKTLFTYKRLILVFGVLADKNYNKMFESIAPLADEIILTKPLSDRALEPKMLLDHPSLKNRKPKVLPDIGEAWSVTLKTAQKDDLICAAGSIYFVGEIRKELRNTLCDY